VDLTGGEPARPKTRDYGSHLGLPIMRLVWETTSLHLLLLEGLLLIRVCFKFRCRISILSDEVSSKNSGLRTEGEQGSC